MMMMLIMEREREAAPKKLPTLSAFLWLSPSLLDWSKTELFIAPQKGQEEQKERRHLTVATPGACSKLITPTAAAACVAQDTANGTQETGHSCIFVCLSLLLLQGIRATVVCAF